MLLNSKARYNIIALLIQMNHNNQSNAFSHFPAGWFPKEKFAGFHAHPVRNKNKLLLENGMLRFNLSMFTIIILFCRYYIYLESSDPRQLGNFAR